MENITKSSVYYLLCKYYVYYPTKWAFVYVTQCAYIAPGFTFESLNPMSTVINPMIYKSYVHNKSCRRCKNDTKIYAKPFRPTALLYWYNEEGGKHTGVPVYVGTWTGHVNASRFLYQQS